MLLMHHRALPDMVGTLRRASGRVSQTAERAGTLAAPSLAKQNFSDPHVPARYSRTDALAPRRPLRAAVAARPTEKHQ